MFMRAKVRANVPHIGLIGLGLVLAVSVPVFARTQPARDPEESPAAARTPIAAAPAIAPQISEKLKMALDAPCAIQFTNEHITRIFEFVSEYAGANIVLDYRVIQPPLPLGSGGVAEDSTTTRGDTWRFGYVTDGMVSSIDLQNLPLRVVVDKVCKPLGLAYTVRPDYLWISTAEMTAKTDFADPSSKADQSIAKALDQRCSIEFNNDHITRILQFLSQYAQVDIVLDQAALPPPERVPAAARPNAIRTVHPYKKLTAGRLKLTGYIPYFRVEDGQLKEVLKALLLPMNLTYRVEPGRIYVTSASKH